MRNLLQPLSDFFSLFYPHLCLACGAEAPPHGKEICLDCEVTLPLSQFHKSKENPFTERFWGRVPLHTGAGMYLFNKKSRIAHLMHQFKYHGKKEIGLVFGEQYGHVLKGEAHFQEIHCIVPVPLHWKKEQVRGYNQSEQFGKGLSQGMGIPCIKDGLERVEHTDSQTKKSRLSRLENMQGMFTVKNEKALKGKHVLLVDDVLTTGATLEMCANEILKVPGTKVSMATLAVAVH